jgi:antirestriction protein ArdC
MTSTSAQRVDVYTRVTSRIIEQLEQGIRPWMKPWNAEHAAGRISRPLRHNGQPYRGINILMLWASAEEREFTSPLWLTFKQASEFGGHVRKGERGSPVVYANTFTKKETNDEGEETEEQIPFLREYVVFNAEQCEGLPGHYNEIAKALHAEPLQRIEHAHEFFTRTGADVRVGGNRAYYSINGDYVQMPDLQAFRDSESHAAVLSHELTHWTC